MTEPKIGDVWRYPYLWKREALEGEDAGRKPRPTALLQAGQSVLEPSAGTGNIARAALAKGAHVHAVEIHPDRVRALEALDDANLTVTAANFLHVPSAAEYDLILMNPPFEGTHWMGMSITPSGS